MKKILLIIVCLLSFTLIACKNATYFRYKDSDKYQIGEATFDVDNVKSIKIEWAGTDAIVTSYEGEKIHIYEELDEGTNEKYQLHYYLNNDTLLIEPCASLMFPQFNFQVKVLHVELPNTMTISNLELMDLELVSTKGTISNVNAKKIKIESVSGSLNVANLNADEIRVRSVSGSIAIDGITSDTLDVEAVSGSIDLKNINANTDVEATSGKIDIYLNSDSSFIIKNKTVSGSIENEFDSFSQGENPITFDIETVSGSIKIHKVIIGG